MKLLKTTMTKPKNQLIFFHLLLGNAFLKPGFSVRKGRSENKNRVKRRQDFFCSCEGWAPPKVVNPAAEQRNRESHKCGCGSFMRVTLKRSFDISAEEWQVTLFKDDHNHKLLSPKQVRFLSTYRSIDKETEDRILLFKKAGLSVRQIMHIIELENNVKHGHLQFLAKDIHNLFDKFSGMMGPTDAMEYL
ncbi:hypothetical protein Cgig2_033966 [Carnegiea gigantea]|uniref:FAR1 domain-containing protein n=1 Tax=Carnegiea gigantea TaxID=171969 RepID=A0A9Q1KEB4_9CARY|nr:hypothetical protein Cgig2_033966 [Carnegiea gigantea]